MDATKSFRINGSQLTDVPWIAGTVKQPTGCRYLNRQFWKTVRKILENHKNKGPELVRNPLILLVAEEGLEPPTRGL